MLLSIPPPASCNDDVKKEDDGDLDLHMIAISQYCADCFDGSCAVCNNNNKSHLIYINYDNDGENNNYVGFKPPVMAKELLLRIYW